MLYHHMLFAEVVYSLKLLFPGIASLLFSPQKGNSLSKRVHLRPPDVDSDHGLVVQGMYCNV